MTTVERYHDISCGHRVYGHESKCAHLHGHNYRITFTCAAADGHVDRLGRVIDFSVIKSTLCQWLEDHWDHKFLLYNLDPIRHHLEMADPKGICIVSFNPTAENMARYLVEQVGPALLAGSGVDLIKVRVEETRKCSATFELVGES